MRCGCVFCFVARLWCLRDWLMHCSMHFPHLHVWECDHDQAVANILIKWVPTKKQKHQKRLYPFVSLKVWWWLWLWLWLVVVVVVVLGDTTPKQKRGGIRTLIGDMLGSHTSDYSCVFIFIKAVEGLGLGLSNVFAKSIWPTEDVWQEIGDWFDWAILEFGIVLIF